MRFVWIYSICNRDKTFLDVGSGCGHMTALGGYLVHPGGVAHGMDILDEAVALSNSSLRKTLDRGINLTNVSFDKRNVFLPDLQHRRWDRIHVGASCPHKEKHKLFELLKPGGIMVMPISNALVRVDKDKNGVAKETKLLDVRYGDLVLPTPEQISESDRLLSMQVVLPASNIRFDYLKMFNNQLLSDIVFLVEGKPLYAHKIILASRSEYFSKWFASGSQAQSSEIIINNCSHAVFEEFLRFIYTDECKVNGIHVAVDLIDIAQKYGLVRLRALMELLLSKNIEVDSACHILETALKYDSIQLKMISFEFILSHYEQVSKTSGFSSMHKDCLTELLHQAVKKINQIAV